MDLCSDRLALPNSPKKRKGVKIRQFLEQLNNRALVTAEASNNISVVYFDAFQVQ
jgi:hypothetical protein